MSDLLDPSRMDGCQYRVVRCTMDQSHTFAASSICSQPLYRGKGSLGVRLDWLLELWQLAANFPGSPPPHNVCHILPRVPPSVCHILPRVPPNVCHILPRVLLGLCHAEEESEGWLLVLVSFACDGVCSAVIPTCITLFFSVNWNILPPWISSTVPSHKKKTTGSRPSASCPPWPAWMGLTGQDRKLRVAVKKKARFLSH